MYVVLLPCLCHILYCRVCSQSGEVPGNVQSFSLIINLGMGIMLIDYMMVIFVSRRKLKENCSVRSILSFSLPLHLLSPLQIVTPERAKHCKLCEGCCRGFDHHCLWLTSCVGYNNHSMFVLFTFFLGLDNFLFVWEAFSCMYVCIHVRAESLNSDA